MERDLISATAYASAAQAARTFQSAQPFRYVVIDNFLNPEVVERMLAEFPAVADPSKLVNEFGDPNPKSAVSEVAALGGVYAELDRFIQTPRFLGLMEQVTGIDGLKYDPYYFGAGTHENFHTAGLDPHYDFNIHPVTRQHRRLNAIIYLNREWKPQWGGSICFHSNAWDLDNDQITEVQPLLNRCVIFETTEKSWHSVPPVTLPPELRHLSRRSFTIYLYTDDRPASERAPDHETVYVQEGLPKTMRPGAVLSQEDYDRIRANVQRRHNYLRALYKREYRFSEHITALIAERQRLRNAVQVPLLGYAKVISADNTLDLDGWLGDHMVLRLRALRPVGGVRLVGWRPTEATESIAIELAAEGVSSRQSCGGGHFELEIRFHRLQTAEFTVTVTSETVRAESADDHRRLSFILDRVEMLHPGDDQAGTLLR